jgi:hypothetical protein
MEYNLNMAFKAHTEVLSFIKSEFKDLLPTSLYNSLTIKHMDFVDNGSFWKRLPKYGLLM